MRVSQYPDVYFVGSGKDLQMTITGRQKELRLFW
jgi:hypothetical protein